MSVATLLAFPVALPLAGAALVAAADNWVPDAVKEIPSMVIAAATAVICVILLVHTERTDIVHWYGGWHPRHGLALGIAFVAGPIGAGMASLVSVLVTAAVVFSWHYMEDASRIYRVLMLVFLAGMNGFALSGDLFNMFVWFEVMGVAAYALCGSMVEEVGPLQGALNFAITNTIGAYMILFGTALVYARTGALNLAQIGRTFGHHRPDGLVVVAFTLIIVGFLIKAAIVPFHLWLADAHAVAPAPVCVLFSGVMVELGLLGVARVYWTAFEGPFAPHAADVRGALVWLGLVTAFVAAVMCFLQRHLKRLLAYSTISHAGMMLVGVGLLDGKSLGGVAALTLGHAFLKGSLFLACGILLRQFGSVDELVLHAKGRRVPVVGAIFGLAAFGLIGFPYVGAFLGHSMIDDAAIEHGHAWIPPLLMVVAGVSAGAILRAGARVFLGWGPKDDPLLSPEPGEGPPDQDSNYPLMVVVTAIVAAIGIAFSVIPGLEDRAEHAGDRFEDRQAYTQRTLFGRVHTYGPSGPVVIHAAQPSSIGYGVGAAAIAFATAAFGLYRRRVPAAVRALGTQVLDRPISGLKALHSGVAGDYVMWITVGTAVLGGVWALTLRGP